MSHIQPRDFALLTDRDVDHTCVSCCGDEDFVLLRCRHCGHIWLECYECSTWFVNLHDLSQTVSSFISDPSARLACPECAVAFDDFNHLADDVVDAYLPNRDHVAAAGFGHFLVDGRADP
ncbi:hypothetical protein [Rhodopirellula bahusiensis]|uniref:hypothetical protein n=1 Tax=Rhodopirellula bahusiensis TaxID=2014065 RepID=UPI0032650071